jgi:hypothetical protein
MDYGTCKDNGGRPRAIAIHETGSGVPVGLVARSVYERWKAGELAPNVMPGHPAGAKKGSDTKYSARGI